MIRVVNASKVTPEAIKLNRDLVRQRSMDISDLEKIMSLPVSVLRISANLILTNIST